MAHPCGLGDNKIDEFLGAEMGLKWNSKGKALERHLIAITEGSERKETKTMEIQQDEFNYELI